MAADEEFALAGQPTSGYKTGRGYYSKNRERKLKKNLPGIRMLIRESGAPKNRTIANLMVQRKVRDACLKRPLSSLMPV